MKYRNLKSLLVKEGITQGEFAKVIGIDKSTLSMKMNGKRDFTKTEIDKIITALSLSYEEIFFDNKINKVLSETVLKEVV